MANILHDCLSRRWLKILFLYVSLSTHKKVCTLVTMISITPGDESQPSKIYYSIKKQPLIRCHSYYHYIYLVNAPNAGYGLAFYTLSLVYTQSHQWGRWIQSLSNLRPAAFKILVLTIWHTGRSGNKKCVNATCSSQ